MQFEKGTKLITLDGQNAGVVDAVVLDPKSHEVLYIVARQGGFLSTTDKLIPLDLVGEAVEDGIRLNADADRIAEQRDFIETQYVSVEDASYAADYSRQDPLGSPATGGATSLYWYPPVGPLSGLAGTSAARSAAGVPSEPGAIRIERNLPEDAVVLRQGIQVIADNGDHVGDIERVITDPSTERATHFSITRGLLLKERKLVPMEWVGELGEKEIHLVVSPRFLDALPDYTPEE